MSKTFLSIKRDLLTTFASQPASLAANMDGIRVFHSFCVTLAATGEFHSEIKQTSSRCVATNWWVGLLYRSSSKVGKQTMENQS